MQNVNCFLTIVTYCTLFCKIIYKNNNKVTNIIDKKLITIYYYTQVTITTILQTI